MKVAIVTESFLPSLNGVTTSVCHVLRHLRERGHEAFVVAPRPAPAEYAGYPVYAVPSVNVRQFPVGVPGGVVEDILAEHAPDVVHVASPFVLGARGLSAAKALRIPAVAVYQTDIASYAMRTWGTPGTPLAAFARRWVRLIHSYADRTLAPSSAALADLAGIGVGETRLWRRGVDLSLFGPRWRDDAGCHALRRRLAPRGETVIGYVGRLAAEKEVHRLAEVADLPGTSLVVVGHGPEETTLRELLPRAHFLGRREQDDLARAYAALDVFVHTGTTETFGQTIQEAAATGLPVVAPRRGGPIDLVDHGRTGLLYDPDTPDGLRQAVRRLTVDEDAWERRAVFGEAGLSAVAGRTWASVVDDLIGHYREVVDASRVAA